MTATLYGENIMRRAICSLTIISFCIVGTSFAEDAKEEAIKKDRKLIEGTWRITALEVNGNKAQDEDARKLTVINGSDGTWILYNEGQEVTRGTSTIDPTQKPKTIDLSPAEGNDKGKVFLGIYELSENTRKLCFAPTGEVRPTEFAAAPNSGHILVIFERDKVDAIKRDLQRIEGTWTVVSLEVSGKLDEDAKKLKFVIGADGSMSVSSEGNEVNQGTSTIDPLKSPKTIDFTPTVGDDKGKLSLGIYEVSEDTLKFCVAPSGKGRPSEFTSTQSNEQILLTLERVKVK